MLRHQQNAQKVNGNNESSIKFYLPYERRIIERISSLSKIFNLKVVNTNRTPLKQRMIINTMN